MQYTIVFLSLIFRHKALRLRLREKVGDPSDLFISCNAEKDVSSFETVKKNFSTIAAVVENPFYGLNIHNFLRSFNTKTEHNNSDSQSVYSVQK